MWMLLGLMSAMFAGSFVVGNAGGDDDTETEANIDDDMDQSGLNPTTDVAPEGTTVSDMIFADDTFDELNALIDGVDSGSEGIDPTIDPNPIADSLPLDPTLSQDGETIIGSEDDDILTGDSGDDVISGENGDDIIEGQSGDDLALGDAGSDTVSGDDGDDTLRGNAGDDTLHGGDGNDLLAGHSGNDALHGGEGEDRLLGGEGDDAMAGDAGDDIVEAGLGNDTLVGGAGSDTLNGGDGNDVIDGEDGEDTAERDYLMGGDGDDTVFLGANDFATGGNGSDMFILGDWVIDGDAARIADYDPQEDNLVVFWDDSGRDAEPEVEVRTSVAHPNEAHILLDGSVIAEVTGGPLAADQIELRPASAA